MAIKFTIFCDKCKREVKKKVIRLMGYWQEEEQEHTNQNCKDLCLACWEKGKNTEWANYCDVIGCELNYPSPPEGGAIIRDPEECKHKEQEKNKKKQFLGGGNSNMPSSISEYLRKNNIQSIHLKNNGKTLLIKYTNGNTDWLVEKIWTYEQKQIQAYLKGNNLKGLEMGKIHFGDNTPLINKPNYWPWIWGIGALIIGGIAVYLIYRSKRKF